jgi:BON domain
MIAKVHSFGTAGLGIAVGLLLLSCPAWSDTLRGTVKDPGAPSSKSGIAGVSLSVRDAKNRELAPGLTDERGEYTVSFVGQKSGVSVVYEKLGFRPRPAVRRIVDTKSPQKPVLLIKEGAGDEYYRTAAEMLAQAEKGSPEDLQDSAIAIAALPENDKAQVLQHLKGVPAVNVLAAVKTAEEDQVLTARIKDKFLADPTLGKETVFVKANNGVVQLWGFTPKKTTKTQAADVARQTEGVVGVNNAILTNERFATTP